MLEYEHTLKLPILAFDLLDCSLILVFIAVCQVPKLCPNTVHVTAEAKRIKRITKVEMTKVSAFLTCLNLSSPLPFLFSFVCQYSGEHVVVLLPL